MGLELFCFFEEVRSSKDILEFFFVEGRISFKLIRDFIFDSVVAEFSEDGINVKIKEINIFKYFYDFIMDCSEIGSE